MRYIDLHTHRSVSTDVFAIRNIFAQDLMADEIQFPFSAGLHPWHINKVNPEECFQRIEKSLTEKNMLAVGECGIDRHVLIDFAWQEYCFAKQAELAEKHGKPLIIHCVRAYNDLVGVKKGTKSSLPWILHGYNGNADATLALMKHDFYFSLGFRILTDPRKFNVIRSIPVHRLFLETDDGPLDIHEVYLLASGILGIGMADLEEIISTNFRNIFQFDVLYGIDKEDSM